MVRRTSGSHPAVVRRSQVGHFGRVPEIHRGAERPRRQNQNRPQQSKSLVCQLYARLGTVRRVAVNHLVEKETSLSHFEGGVGRETCRLCPVSTAAPRDLLVSDHNTMPFGLEGKADRCLAFKA